MLRFRRTGSDRAAALLCLLLALALYPAAPRASEPDTVFLRYEVRAGPGLHVLTLRVTVRQSDQDYSIAAEAETRYLADLFVDLRSRLEVTGRISRGALLPVAMRAATHRRGQDFYTRIDYAADGTVQAEVRPPPTREVTPVSPPQMRGTIDQMTAYLVLARHLGRGESCASVLAVFDGRRRYDLSFAEGAAETLPEFTGPSTVCRMSRRRIAGFAHDRDGATTDEGKLWFARLLPGELMIPVRVEFAGEFGKFTAALAELRGRGVFLSFRE